MLQTSYSNSNISIFIQDILDNEDCEELDPGSGSIHSAGSLSLSQHPQTKAAVNRIQLNSRSGQKISSGSEKVLPPNSLNLTSTISKYCL